MNNTFQRVTFALAENDISLATNLLYKLIDQNEPQAFLKMGLLYKDGKYLIKDLEKAYYFTKRATDLGLKSAFDYAFDISLKLPGEQLSEMIETAETYANKDYGPAYIRLGRIYKDGIGVKKNLITATNWMKKAVDKKIDSASGELFDILWMIDTPDSLNEAYNLALKYSSTKPTMAGRLGRLYRDGKGVPKDLTTAGMWMKQSADSGCYWAKWEYYNILLNINTPDSLKTMIEYSQAESNKGNMELRARLARAYRDGKGVQKDLNKAAELMKTVLPGNPVWARWEYLDLLRMINTPESNKEAFEYAYSIISLGKEIEARIGRMYRDGRGVQADLNTAAEWMRKASDQKLEWAQWELFDILWNIDTPESLKEMIQLAEPLATANNRELQGRLGRAYRNGKGVEKNLQKAAEWMKKAADQNLPWAIKELAEINSEIAKEMEHKTN